VNFMVKELNVKGRVNAESKGTDDFQGRYMDTMLAWTGI